MSAIFLLILQCKKVDYLKKLFFILLLCAVNILVAQNVADIHEKYQGYRSRLLDEWLVTSESVEQFGVNIPAMDRRVDSNGKKIWISWRLPGFGVSIGLMFMLFSWHIVRNIMLNKVLGKSLVALWNIPLSEICPFSSA